MKRFLIVAGFWLLWATGAVAGVSCTLPFNLTNGTTADASQVMANYNALVTCLGNAAGAGNNTDITILSGLTTPISPAEGGTSQFLGANSTGTNAIIVASTTPSNFTLTKNYVVRFVAGFTNTGATTLNVNGTGVTNVYRQTPAGPIALAGGEIVAGNIVAATFDGTQYQIPSTAQQLGGYGPLTSIASATTTDLGTIGSHLAAISGTTTITSFGSSAVTALPNYRVCFTGAVLLTYNATNLILPTAANITTAANDCADVLYLGSGNWQVTDYQTASGAALSATINQPLCGANNLKIFNNAGTPNTNIDVSADAVVTINSSRNTTTRAAAAFTINTTTGNVTSTANGMDGENRPTSGWVYIYAIDNGTAVAGLGSQSATAPTLPAGYTFSCRIGAMVTDVSNNFLRTRQLGKQAQYVVTASTNTAIAPNIANGAVGSFSTTSPTLVTASVAGFVPSTASVIIGMASNGYKGGGAGSILVAPNTGWGGTNNGPNGSTGQVWPAYINSAVAVQVTFNLVLEGSTIAWVANGGGGAISALGWIDQVNAN